MSTATIFPVKTIDEMEIRVLDTKLLPFAVKVVDNDELVIAERPTVGPMN
jgi:hypothetical protein